MVNGSVAALRARQQQLRGQVIKRQTPARTFTQADIDIQVARARDEFIRNETQKVNNEIDNFTNDIAGFELKRQRSINEVGGIGSENRGLIRGLDDEIARARRSIRELANRRSDIVQGFSSAQITAQAQSQVRFDIARIEFEQAQEQERIQQEQALLPSDGLVMERPEQFIPVGRTITGRTLFFDPLTGQVTDRLFSPAPAIPVPKPTGAFVRAPKKSVVDVVFGFPGQLFEDVSGEKPKQVFREFVGSERTVVDPFTLREFGAETAKFPLKVIDITGTTAGQATEKGFETFAPEFKGFEVRIPEQKLETFRPEFGTLTFDQPTGFVQEELIIPERTPRIFEPQRTAEGVALGSQLGVFVVAPAFAVAPGLVVEGVETALDPTLPTQQRLLGVAEAELGLLIGGLGVKNLVRDLDPIVLRDIRQSTLFKEKAGKAPGKAKQETKAETEAAAKKKKKKVTKKEVIDFLKTDVTERTTFDARGRVIKEIEIKEIKTFEERRRKARILLDSARSAEGRKEGIKILREAFGDKFVDDFLAQELPSLSLFDIGPPSVSARRIPREPVSGRAFEDLRPTIEFVPDPSPLAFEQFQLKPGEIIGITTRPGKVRPIGVDFVRDTKVDVKIDTKLDVKTFDITKVDQNLAQLTSGVTRLDTRQIQVSKIETKLDTAFKLDTGFKIDTAFKFDTGLKLDLGFDPGRVRPTVKEKPKPRKKIRPPILFLFRGDEDILGVRKVSRKPYDVFVKTGGRKRKIGDNITKNQALDLGAFVVDNSLSAEFGITKSKGKIKDVPINVPNNYFAFNQSKFRNFRIKMGNIIPIKNTFIERRNRRLDTAGEVNKITAKRLISRQQTRNKQMEAISTGFQNILGPVSPPKKRKSSPRGKASPKRTSKKPKRKK